MSIKFLLCVWVAATCGEATKIVPQITCSPEFLEVRIGRAGVRSVELEKWNEIKGCESKVDSTSFSIKLELTPDLPCGTTRVRNKLTDESLYYHKVSAVDSRGKLHRFKVSCFVSRGDTIHSNIVKRNVLPPEFVEPDYIEITSEVTGTAPIPELSVGVRQGGRLIGNQITVEPGAPLVMEVYLDNESASTYGILVSYMMVTDTSRKNETIIYNGCTNDHYVFENFKTTDGNFLTAKFRAFKFPESNYLLFRGTVDVCLDTCQGIRCSNGEVGFGRRRRSVFGSDEANKVFEVTMMTFIKFKQDKHHLSEEFVFPRHRKSSFSIEESAGKSSLLTQSPSKEEYVPPFVYFQHNSASSLAVSSILPILVVSCLQTVLHL